MKKLKEFFTSEPVVTILICIIIILGSIVYKSVYGEGLSRREAAIESRCAEYLTENYDTWFEEELVTIYNYITEPADFDSKDDAIDAVRSICDKLDDIHAVLDEMEQGKLDIFSN